MLIIICSVSNSPQEKVTGKTTYDSNKELQKEQSLPQQREEPNESQQEKDYQKSQEKEKYEKEPTYQEEKEYAQEEQEYELAQEKQSQSGPQQETPYQQTQEEQSEKEQTYSQEQENKTSQPEQPVELIVTRVIDGDTIELSNGEKVRLIGINAPEVNEKCYEESKRELQNMVLGKAVTLEQDVEDRDHYGRLLRYVYVDDTFVNLEMVRLGLAHKYEYGLNTKYSDLFEQAENEAKQNKGCLWETEEVDYTQDQCIYIVDFHYNAEGNDNYNLNDEYVIFGNKCSYSIDMSGWTVKDETASHIYTFPSFVLEAGAKFTLYTGTGTDTNSALYWGRTPGNYAAIWNNDGDTLFLRDSNGNLVLSYSY